MVSNSRGPVSLLHFIDLIDIIGPLGVARGSIGSIVPQGQYHINWHSCTSHKWPLTSGPLPSQCFCLSMFYFRWLYARLMSFPFPTQCLWVLRFKAPRFGFVTYMRKTALFSGLLR